MHQGSIVSFSTDEQFEMAQQNQQHRRSDKVRAQTGAVPAGHPLVPIEEEEEEASIYGAPVAAGGGANNMLSEMFNYASHSDVLAAAAAHEIGNLPSVYHRLIRPDFLIGGNNRPQGVVGATPNIIMNTNNWSSSVIHDQADAAASIFGEGINFGGGMRESQLGPSLSLSSPLQQLELRKGEDPRGARSQGSAAALSFYNSQRLQEQQWQASGHQIQDQYQQLNMPSSSYGSIGAANVLRNSKYARAAQELLEEFCSVSRGHVRGNTTGIRNSSVNPTKDMPPFYPPDRFENQRRKSRLLSMLDEVERRYNRYCEQMQGVVNSFDSVMGFGASMPYAALARKAMSRHFRCLKDGIAAQVRRSCELLGENDGGSGGSGLTKGETPKLRLIDQTLRQQRAFHHEMGMMEQEAWRPQRGLPDRSVTVLRSWLFDHFLHPYPSDADKHLLARKTGLSRNQVSNWFINARVRLWKPMVEDMYQQEAKEDSRHNEGHDANTVLLAAAAPTTQQQQQPHSPESDAPAQLDHYDDQPPPPPHHLASSNSLIFPPPSLDDEMYRRAAAAAARTGDLSLTLGLRHAGGNAPDTGAYFGL